MSNADIALDSKEWRQMLARLNRSAKGVESILRAAFGTFGFSDIIQHFSAQRGPDGPWAKRSQSTQMRYEKIMTGKWSPPKGTPRDSFNPGNKILSLTGYLRQSIVPTNLKTVNKNAVMLTANTPYSGKHDRGEDGMPQRSFMWLSDKAQDQMAGSILDLWLKGR